MESPSLKEQGYLPRRYMVAIMAFLGMVCNYMLRVNINLTIVAMVKGDPNASQNNNSAKEICNYTDSGCHGEEQEGEFQWDAFTQSLITSSFFMGYLWTQVPGGRIAELFGARRVFGGALTAASFLTLLIPFTARPNAAPLIANRILLGISEGATFPSTHALLSTWSPPKERSTLSTIIYAGSQAGTVVAYPLSSALITSLGWESVFYVQSCITLVWCFAWFMLVADSPYVDTKITAAEKKYIITAIGDTKDRKPPPVPLRAALTSLPFWAILFSNMGNNWGFFTLLTEMPLYMSTMLLQDIKSNALLNALPYLGMWIFSLVISKVGDTLIQKNIASTGVVRKTANTISQLGPAACLIGITFLHCDRTSTIALFTLATTLQGGIYTGFLINHIDIAPNFAGTLFGITNALGTIPSWVGPITTGALTKNQQTFEQWNKVFYIASGIYMANAFFYLAFSSGEVQPWNHIAEPVGAARTKSASVAKDTTQTKHRAISDSIYDVYVVTPHAAAYVNSAYKH
ncbi:putative inorganic phosphate cotransporter [Scylla paramamosain]|uniref:putative inorganic phosphate cotransporter n=1 Tax=Scylla paramamosain TaxID=85552 RepID=UPI003082E873